MSTNAILFGVLFVLVAVAIFFIIRVEIRLKKLFKGSDAKSLEGLMKDVVAGIHVLSERTDVQKEDIEKLRERLRKQGRSVKLVRFNPFKDVGGNQSFAVSFVNEDGDGVVFSSLYSRERMSVFAKPIIKGTSDIELSEEERSVVKAAHEDAGK